MLFRSKLIRDEQILDELKAYNPLIPDAGELSATLFLELTSDAEMREWLPKLVGIEKAVRVRLGSGPDALTVAFRPDQVHSEQLTREEVTAAVEGARRGAPGLPLVTTMTFDSHGRTMMGTWPKDAAPALLELGAVAVGANCGTGPAEIENAIGAMHAANPEAILIAKGNAGVPRSEEHTSELQSH